MVRLNNFLTKLYSYNFFLHLAGKIKLPSVDGYPTDLKDLMTDPTYPNHKNFRDNIRSYNSAFAMCSMGVNSVKFRGGGPYVFKIHGQVYHQTSHVVAATGQTPQYAQLHIMDCDIANDLRSSHVANQDCRSIVFNTITSCLTSNVLIQTYHMMKEVMEREEEKAQRENRQIPLIHMDLISGRQGLRHDQHPGRYNAPTASNEIAMIFVDANGEPPFHRDLRVYPKNPVNSQRQGVSMGILDVNLEPMTYPLLIPHGNRGWGEDWIFESYENIVHNKRVTMLQYYSAKMQVREEEFNPFISAGKLTQQWLVDSYSKAEANNLNYIKTHQKDLRCDNYKDLQDGVRQSNVPFRGRGRGRGRGTATTSTTLASTTATNLPAGPSGRAMVLPSTFKGSPRQMTGKCRDAMAMFAAVGAPDLFITFTCNPNWKEIQENLRPFEKAHDRPDLVARVFNLKLESFINDITKQNLFGRVVCFARTIEFQKRGLPHCHMLFTLQAADKFRSPEVIDKYVRAEIPDKTKHPRLFEIVTKSMIHGPCGAANQNSPCMVNGKCTKAFPKLFNNSTQMSISGYPLYRRRRQISTGVHSVQVRGKPVDNRYVVPYNRDLLLKYNAHINVEVCTSLKCVRYIYKYIYKGYDCAKVSIGVRDEVNSYIDNRYLSAPEACWHLNTFKMNSLSHSVVHLSVHLELHQNVTFQAGYEQLALENSGSTLIAWFQLNQADLGARQYLYSQIPLHYIYVKQTRKWRPRVQFRDKIVARIYGVSPTVGEAFYLRMMLLHVPGAQSFQDLRTINGTVCNTFKEAAIALHLLDDDSVAREFLRESNDMQMPLQVREAFAYLLIFHEPRDPVELWNDFKDDLTIDYFNERFSNEDRYNRGLLHIESILIQHNKKCSDFNLPSPSGEYEEFTIDPAEMLRDAEDRIGRFNDAQSQAFNAIKNAVEICTHEESLCFFIDGPGGSGKTYLYETLIKYMRGKLFEVYPLATTGIAATLLPGGNTVHSGFKLPLNMDETATCNLTSRMALFETIKNSKLIIIDEISMLSKYALKAIDRLLKEMMNNQLPFGGKVFVVGGDFRQTLPVIKGGGERASIEICVKSSPLWSHFKCLSLTENMRVNHLDTSDFSNYLLRVGNGNEATIYNDLIQIPQNLLATTDLTTTFFENLLDQDFDLSGTVILTPTNINVRSLNEKIIGSLPTEEKKYLSADTNLSDNESDIINYPVEFFNSLCPSGFPPHKLTLKIGTVIMLIRNLNRKKKLCNGTRLIVSELRNNFIVANKIIDNEAVIIPRIDLHCEENDMPFKFKRKQFPVIPAFAMTINKSQGQTFNKVGLMLYEPVFSHGQLYVAMSRCRSSEGLKIGIVNSVNQGNIFHDSRIFTKNIVFKEVINDAPV